MISVMTAVSGMVTVCFAPVLEKSSLLSMYCTPFLTRANFSEVNSLLRFAVCAGRTSVWVCCQSAKRVTVTVTVTVTVSVTCCHPYLFTD